jgi:hypothetical protein
VISWFQAFAFKFNLYHYNEGRDNLNLQITFDADDAAEAGVDPLFADKVGLYKLNPVDPIA